MNATTDKAIKPKAEPARVSPPTLDGPDIHALVTEWVRSRDKGEMEEIYVVYKPVGRRRGVIPVNIAAKVLGEPVGTDGLTDGERVIFNVFVESDKPLTRKEVAVELDQKTATGRFGEQFRQLLAKEKLFTRGRHHTNDVTKFAAMDKDEE